MAKFSQNRRARSPMSEDQRKKLSEAQKRYVSSDPRWADHRRKLAEAQQRTEQKAILSAASWHTWQTTLVGRLIEHG
jgi:hypothetical protein